MGGADLAEELGAAVEVLRVGHVPLGVAALAAGEDAVGAEVDEPRPHLRAPRRQAVGEERVHLERGDGVARLGALLDDADGVHHRLRPEVSKDLDHSVEATDVDVEERPARRGREPAVGPGLAPEGDPGLVRAVQRGAKLMPEHPVPAQDQDAQRCSSIAAAIVSSMRPTSRSRSKCRS
jgi:hypothetical protein